MRKRRVGFTLVELLVVIAIIGILAALIVPAVQNVIVTGRDAQCKNNMRNIGLAMTNYVSSKQFYPGYRNAPVSTVAGADSPISWQTALLPNLEQRALYDKWVEGAAAGQRLVPLEVMSCPGDTTASGTDLPVTSYAVNAGQPGNAVATSRYDGVCHDLNQPIATRNQLRLSLTDFRDGATNTVLVIENMDANVWHLDPSVHGNPVVTNDPEDFQAIISTNPFAQYRINERKGRRGPSDLPTPTPFTAPNPSYARPSSGHNGTFNVVMGDGSTKAINETVATGVWQLLMSPWGAKCVPPQTATLSGTEY